MTRIAHLAAALTMTIGAGIALSACTYVERDRPTAPPQTVVVPAPQPQSTVVAPAAPPTVTVRPNY
jgi:multidrug efflux pump subunit AcrA (membrane-fusion protein)